MLQKLRAWILGDGGRTEPLCFVLSADPALSEQLVSAMRQLHIKVEPFSTVADAQAVVAQWKTEIVFIDVALGAEGVSSAIRLAAGLAKRPLVQLISSSPEPDYEQICAVGQARLLGGDEGLKMLPLLHAPFKQDVLRRITKDIGPQPGGINGVTLEQAIKRKWLELFYQPKIELATKRLVGAEGLIRARHPKLGVLGPGAFLPGAHEKDMLAMTERVILAALRDWEDCAANGVSVRLSVNTPVSALTKLPIAKMIRENRPKAANWPGLILEVTEDEIIRDLPLANDVADQLRPFGCSLAMDDFGTGYSSIGRLRQLPFTELKIDRSYVIDCNSDSMNAGLCETVVELAHRFGMKTVAEGIETPHESHKLQAIGCHIGQGFLFSKPLSKDQFVSLLRRRMVVPSDKRGPAATALQQAG